MQMRRQMNVFVSWKFCDETTDVMMMELSWIKLAIKLETVAFAAKEWLIEGKMMERDCFVS